jgi:hypothetical protein
VGAAAGHAKTAGGGGSGGDAGCAGGDAGALWTGVAAGEEHEATAQTNHDHRIDMTSTLRELGAARTASTRVVVQPGPVSRVV